MKTTSKLYSSRLVLALLGAMAGTAQAQIDFNGTTHVENFDGLISSSSVASAFSATINAQAGIPALAGWQAAKVAGTGSGATAFTADTGSNSGGLVYSYGASGSTERALGVVASGSNIFAIGPAFKNVSGRTITSVTIRLTAEFWRSSTAVQNTLTFAYGLSGGSPTFANFLSDSSLTPLSSLNIVGPQPVSSNGALDGNLAANRKQISVLIDNLNWADGQTLFLRWTDFNDGGNDAGLAIDSFSLIEGIYVDPNDVSRGTANNLFTPTSFAGSAFTAANNAVFNGAAATTTLSGAVVANALKFQTDGHVLTGTVADSISITSGSVEINGGITGTISGVIAGAGGLQKAGAGALVLGGANTFTGTVTIGEGRLQISDDASLGNSDNDLSFAGTLATGGDLSLGAGRTLTGSGTIETGSAASLTIAGPLSGAGLSIVGATSVNLNGATNTASTLSFAVPVALSIATGNLAITSSLNFNQTTGSSTVAGGLNFGTVATTLTVGGGTLTPSGTFTAALTGGTRITKSGAGTLDLTSTTFSGTGAFRLGIQGGFPAEGGRILVNDAADLGTLQTQFNSGIIEATVPLTFTTGLSIGGRAPSIVSRAVLEGADMVFTGASGFFSSSGSGNIALAVNNNTTLGGAFTPTVAPTSGTPDPSAVLINLSGSGSLTVSGDASLLLDNIYVNGGLELNLTGTLGGESLQVDSGSSLAGGGLYSGAHIVGNPAATPTPIPDLYRLSNAIFYSGSTLAPTGKLEFQSNLTLEGGSSTVISINGTAIDTDYDSIDISIPAGAAGTISSYTLTYGGDLVLSFGAAAQNGAYNLFTTGSNVSRSGSFSSVTLAGSHTGSLSGPSSGVWSGSAGGTTFSFDESTGVLTVTGGAAAHTALESWRFAKFGVYEDTGAVLAGDNEDFDGDGIANLIEYATGTEPAVANASVVTTAKAGDFLTLSFPVISDSSLTYTVLASSDLATTFTTGAGSTSETGGVRTYTDNVSLATAGVRRFLRLQVSYVE